MNIQYQVKVIRPQGDIVISHRRCATVYQAIKDAKEIFKDKNYDYEVYVDGNFVGAEYAAP